MKILYLITITSIGLIAVLFGYEIKIVHASEATEIHIMLAILQITRTMKQTAAKSNTAHEYA